MSIGYAVYLYENNGVVQACRNKEYKESFITGNSEVKGIGATDNAAINNLQVEESKNNIMSKSSLYVVTT